jgi:hypothetical protein
LNRVEVHLNKSHALLTRAGHFIVWEKQMPIEFDRTGKQVNRPLKNAHLLRFAHPSSLRRTDMYASFLGISQALHLGIFPQPVKSVFSTRC